MPSALCSLVQQAASGSNSALMPSCPPWCWSQMVYTQNSHDGLIIFKSELYSYFKKCSLLLLNMYCAKLLSQPWEILLFVCLFVCAHLVMSLVINSRVCTVLRASMFLLLAYIVASSSISVCCFFSSWERESHSSDSFRSSSRLIVATL